MAENKWKYNQQYQFHQYHPCDCDKCYDFSKDTTETKLKYLW